MSLRRSTIELFLNELKSYEDGMKFQSFAVVIAKQKWPELIACERKKDLGADAYAPAETSAGRVGKVLACSITADIKKINDDAKKVKENFTDVTTLIFATSGKVTNTTAATWIEEIKKEFGYQLVLITREEIIASLIEPTNAPLCRSFGITSPIEEDVVELVEKVKEASAKLIKDRLSQAPLSGKPLIPLRSIRLDHDGGETAEILQLDDIKTMLRYGRRIVLEAPAGRGKTTTLVQLADQYAKNQGIALLIDLPSWIISGKDILEFTAGLPCFRSQGVDAQTLAKIYDAEHITFLLNGWNEIADNYSEKALTELQQLERTFPSAGILVATRTHHLTPPLPGALRTRLLPLNRTQRAEYLKNALGNQCSDLRSKLDNDIVLDQLTRTPLILSKVVDLFSAGLSIPSTKMGVLDSVMNLIEQSTEHKNQLQLRPLTGHARSYLSKLSMQMLFREEVIISEKESLPIVGSVSDTLRDSGQISTIPEPQTIINALCAHHVLERQDYPSITLRFEHQQFQEFFAALRLRSELLALCRSNDQAAIREFTKKYINEPIWTEPLEMLAEEIGSTSEPKTEETIKIGVLLVKMALKVSPILAAHLAYLCGEEIWQIVSRDMGAELRDQYESKDKHDKHIALAAMIATGSSDFKDIIIPLVTDDNLQTRLSAYRCYDQFYPSSLGPNWQKEVQKWDELARLDFVREAIEASPDYREIEDFALKDPSTKVKKAVIEWTSLIGTPDDVQRLLDKMSREDFEKIALKLRLQKIPQKYHSAVVDILEREFSDLNDPKDCLRNLLAQADLNNVDLDRIKTQLEKIEWSSERETEIFCVKPALNIIRRSDPDWVSKWVIEQIANSSLSYKNWEPLTGKIPDELAEEWLSRLINENLGYKNYQNLIDLLKKHSSEKISNKAFLKLCELKRKHLSANNEKLTEDEYNIKIQLEELLRSMHPNCTVKGLPIFDKNFNRVEFHVMLDIFKSNGGQEQGLRENLDEDLRQKLRTYIKDCIPKALEESDPDGSLKSDLASCLGRVGEPEDMADFDSLLQADIERLKDAINKNKTRTSHCHHFINSLVELDENRAQNIISKLIDKPLYGRESAKAFVKMAVNEDSEESCFAGYISDQKKIIELRSGKRLERFDENKREKYSHVIQEQVKKIIAKLDSGEELVYHNLLDLAHSLSILDPENSKTLILDCIQKVKRTYSAHTVLDILTNLLHGESELSTKSVMTLIDEVIENIKRDPSGNVHNSLLKKILYILPFLDNPNESFAKIRQIIDEFHLRNYSIKEVMPCLGVSKKHEAVTLLKDLAGKAGENLDDFGENWFEALKGLKTKESREVLLSFIDPDIITFEQMPNLKNIDHPASCIAEMAKNDPEIYKLVINVCDKNLSDQEKEILCEIIAKVNDEESILAALNMLDDNDPRGIPHSLSAFLMNSFIESKPVGKSQSSYTLSPQSSNRIRTRLFEMSQKDSKRKMSATALLKQIDALRVQYGKPLSEPWNPKFSN